MLERGCVVKMKKDKRNKWGRSYEYEGDEELEEEEEENE